MNDRPRESSTGRKSRRHLLIAAGMVIGAIAASPAVAIDVPLPTTTSLQAGASPQATTKTAAATTATVPAAAPVTPVATTAPRVDWSAVLGSRDLRMGMAGSDVKQLQSVLRRRGERITADGSFGRMTRGAVIRTQKRLRLRLTGVVGPAMVRRLGVVIPRVPQRVPQNTTPVDTASGYPLAGPNAAKARHLKVFPVAGKHSYINDFGAGRHQGAHQGNDIMADRVPVRAVVDGTVTRANRVESGLGGIYIWLQDAAGNDFYYAHLTSIDAGIEPGTHVTAGRLLGVVGNTGDARYGATHLHFEIRPNGSAPISPYTDLLAVDPEPPIGK